MRELICTGPREETAGVLGSGPCRYEMDFEWAKWPEELAGVHVLNGCFDDDGTLYAATDDKDHPIVAFSGDGTFLRSFGAGLFSKAHSVYITPRRTILTADTAKNAHVIREITMDGQLVRDFGTFGVPGDSGYDFDYLSVLEREGRVPDDPAWQKRAAANARLDSIVRIGKPFCRPCAMVMNDKGEYFAADGYGNAAVHKFAADGSYLTSWGGPGQEYGRFRLVHDVRIDSLGRVWVSDRENSRVQVFDQDGRLLAVIRGDLMRIGAVWPSADRIYIGELDGGVTVLDLELNVLTQFGWKGSPIHAHGICARENGDLFVFTNKKNPNNILRLARRD